MSSTEDVLDNWEEIDERMLNDQIHQIRRGIDAPAESVQQNGLPRIMMPADDLYANSYTQPAKPIVKILRRPTQNSHEVKSCESKPKQPIKTLQQREQEYAQARLRILGSAKNPEDDQESNVVSVTNSTSGSNETKSIDKTDGDAISTNENPSEIRKMEGVLRMPKGPNGTPGFIARR